ncbi:MAG: hypothetical protein M2R45_04726 [Verrucomicrobia subdivision 3 bacterium]|nr:hypothetical protein [Limisphaerales bacterium]MCS1415746.1 hypothetical protein [Limisphaerales bacterium]
MRVDFFSRSKRLANNEPERQQNTMVTLLTVKKIQRPVVDAVEKAVAKEKARAANSREATAATIRIPCGHHLRFSTWLSLCSIMGG